MRTREPEPGELMRLVGDAMASRGFGVQYPESEGDRRLTITDLPVMNCTITVDDYGGVMWQYWPKSGYYADPGQLVSLALNVLTPDGHHSFHSSESDGSSLQRVGHALRAAGLGVRLDAYTDQDDFTLTAEIVAVSPADRERGEIGIDEHGRITWECSFNIDAIPAVLIAETVANILSGEMAGSSAAGEIASDDQAGRGSAGT